MLGPRLGLGPKSRQSYVNLDMGDRQPTEAEQRVLAEWLGGYPDYMAGTEQGDTLSVPAAYLERLDRYATLVTRLVEQNAVLMRELGLSPLPPDVPDDVRETIQAAQERRRSGSTLRPADPTPDRGRSSQALSAG